LREFEHTFDEGLRRGLRRHHSNPRNNEALVKCLNTKPSERGLVPIDLVTYSVTDTNGAVSWPFPQMFRLSSIRGIAMGGPVCGYLDMLRSSSGTITERRGLFPLTWAVTGTDLSLDFNTSPCDENATNGIERDNTLTVGSNGSTGTFTTTDKLSRSCSYSFKAFSWAVVSHRANSSQNVVTLKVAHGDDATCPDAVTDTLELYSARGTYTCIERVESSDIFVIGYTDDANDGRLASISVSDAGVITKVDEREFEPTVGKFVDVFALSATVIAVTFNGSSGLTIGTVSIDGSGNLGSSWIDFLVIDAGAAAGATMCHLTGDCYVLAWEDRNMATITIDDDGNISNALVDNIQFDASNGDSTHIMHVGSSMVVVAYTGLNDDGYMKTFSIDGSGTITSTPLSTLEFDTSYAGHPRLEYVTGEVWVVAYTDSSTKGTVKSMTINATTGAISAVIDSLQFESVRITHHVDMAKARDDTAIMIVYADTNSQQKVIGFTCDDAGDIASAISDYVVWDGSWAGYMSIAMKR
jgi:hypothetical protein